MNTHQAEETSTEHCASVHVSGTVGVQAICSGLADDVLERAGLDPVHGIMLVGRMPQNGRIHCLRVMTANEAMTNYGSSHYFKIFMRRDARRCWWIVEKKGMYVDRIVDELEKEKITKRCEVPQLVDMREQTALSGSLSKAAPDRAVIAIKLGSSRWLFTMDNAGGMYS